MYNRFNCLYLVFLYCKHGILNAISLPVSGEWLQTVSCLERDASLP